MKVKVFLLDFGSTIDRVDVTTKVRHLRPTRELSQDPLAFKIILAGLYPVSMDIDWDLPSGASMQQSRSPHTQLSRICNGLVLQEEILGWQCDEAGEESCRPLQWAGHIEGRLLA